MSRLFSRKALGWGLFAAGLVFGGGSHWIALESGRLVARQTLAELRESWDLGDGVRWSVRSGKAYAPMRARLDPSMNPLRAMYEYCNYGQTFGERPSESLRLVVLDAQGTMVFERESSASTQVDNSSEFECNDQELDVFRVDRPDDYFLVLERLPASELVTFKSELSLRQNVRLRPPLAWLWIGLVVAVLGLAMAVKPVKESRR